MPALELPDPPEPRDYDPRLAGLYDVDNPDGPDHDFWRMLALEFSAQTIVDLGCGTGMLTASLAQADAARTVVGVDPSESMLRIARHRPGGPAVRWVRGDASALRPGGAAEVEPASVDLALLTGNVAQHITGAGWPAALAALATVLRPGGVLGFESRDPRDRAWEAWAAEPRSARDTLFGVLHEWLEVEPAEPVFVDGQGEVELLAHNLFDESGEHVIERQRLVFRTASRLRSDLEAAGFEVTRVSSDWSRSPVPEARPCRILIVEARRR